MLKKINNNNNKNNKTTKTKKHLIKESILLQLDMNEAGVPGTGEAGEIVERKKE